MGNHFAGGADAWSVNGIYTCEFPKDPNCKPFREGILQAIGNDPDLGNWLPVRAEFLHFNESYE